MGRAALILLMGGADIVHILLIPCGNGLAYHACAAIAAENHSAEQSDRLTARAAAGIAFQHFLNAVKINLGDNRFMAVLDDRPLALIFGNALVDFIAWRGLLALYKNTGVDGVLQDTDDRSRRPKGFCTGLEGSGKLHSKGPFVFHGGKDAELVQSVGYILGAYALQFPFEYVTDNIGGVLVNHQFVFVLLVFQISESGKGTEELPVLPLDFKLGANLYRNITAISFVYEVLERNDEVIRGIFISEAVIIVVDGDEPDAQKRKYLLDILAGVQVITAKAG